MKAPKIEHPHGTIGVLERRLVHLEHRIDNPPHGNYAASKSIDYDRAEVDALRIAILAVEYVAHQQEGN